MPSTKNTPRSPWSSSPLMQVGHPFWCPVVMINTIQMMLDSFVFYDGHGSDLIYGL